MEKICIPTRLTDRKQWAVGRWHLKRTETDDGIKSKWRKWCYTPDMVKEEIKAWGWNTPDQQIEYDFAVDIYKDFKKYLNIVTPNEAPIHNNWAGVCYVLHEDENLVCVDLDKILDDKMKFKDQKLEEMVKRVLPKTFTEYSKSRRGLHIFINAKMPLDNNGTTKSQIKEAGHPVEIFGYNKQIWVTGLIVDGSCREITDHQGWLDEMIELYHPDWKTRTSQHHEATEIDSPSITPTFLKHFVMPKLKRSKFWDPDVENTFAYDCAFIHRIIDSGVSDFDQIVNIFAESRDGRHNLDKRITYTIPFIYNMRVRNGKILKSKWKPDAVPTEQEKKQLSSIQDLINAYDEEDKNEDV